MVNIIQSFITRSKLVNISKKEDKVSFEYEESGASFIVSIPNEDIKKIVKQYIKIHRVKEK